jgi:hypothetical protein
MPTDIAPLVTGTSVMLAAFGFFYNAVKDGIDDALELSTSPASEEIKSATRKKLKAARSTAGLLAIVALVVCALLASQTVTEIKAAIEVRFALDEYSTLDAIFVAMAFAWVGIASFCLWRVVRLSAMLRQLPN